MNAKLTLAIKSGKYTLGYKSVVKSLRQGKAKLIIIAGNTPVLRKSELEYYAMLSKTSIYYFQGGNNELGTACGKLFRVGTLAILDAVLNLLINFNFLYRIIMSEKPTTSSDAKLPSFDIYIRMNSDDEKDYCFQVTPDQKFSSLFDIFKTLPLNLTPSIFYELTPIAFQVSKCPGFLSRTGGLLFGDDATNKKYLVNVSNDDLISEKCWPGQLINPIFQERTFFKYTVYSALLTWLYTDLPDFISPTPGICLTNWGTKGLCYAIDHWLGKPQIAKNIYDDMFSDTTIVGQCVFFIFHFFKVLIIWVALYIGLANPYSLVGKKPPTIEREDLLRIGWTGAKKASSMNYKQHYREMKIKEAGGILKAHHEGLLETLKNNGVELGKGEGFQTPIDLKNVKSFESVKNNKKFVLTYEYLSKLETHFHRVNAKLDDQEFNIRYKDLRTYGPLDIPDDLKEYVDARIALGDGDVEEDK
ncbi:hypothetical protein CANARDRAFT_9549 [[Candida] arabinofermentans NRRL YB-2248]|uniref:Ribosomal protein eL8/eL30/eS12/Gadd45 domain-containing protein n=1 Tax=[Candida] arabinofermentans NRRL YB-2248 TaxID=983967 RepID=A0A1E4SVF4_9ASCO|nr:hypothetical protein CANARDRAFT_9549 [[Candida] arabinofermentans NRRL YB-2248]